MPTDEELLAIKDRATAQLSTNPNVTGVGIGGRVRAGERINELVLKVYVTKKLPSAEVDPSSLIPAEFEGIPTDVAELPAAGTLAQAPTGKPEVPVAQLDGRRQRPLVGGSRLQVDLAGSGFGTLGCMFVNIADLAKVYALTNWHVLLGRDNAPPTFGTTKAGQPSSDDSITKCCSSIIGKVAGGNRDTTSDIGLVQLDPGSQWKADILEIGSVAGKHTITPTEAGTHIAVRKRGARSGLTGGTIDSIGATKNVDGITFNNTIIVAPNPDTSQPVGTPLFFDQHGDSGSALVNDANEVVGVVFAVPNPDPPPNAGYHGLVTGWALPIDDLIAAVLAHNSLQVDVAVGVLPGIVNTVPGAPMVAVPPEVVPVLTGSREPVSVPIGGLAIDAPPEEALARLQRDLDRSDRGRALITLWLEHQTELLRLLNSNRRVATVWHRSGGAALFQVLVRMLSESELALPTALHGQPLTSCLDRLYAAFDRFASPELRADLARAHDELPDLGGLSYSGICTALAAG
jgi:hypothetical protein